MGTQILVAGGKGVLGSWEARARWVKGLMVVEIAVGLRAKAAVHTCTVCISMWRRLVPEGRHDSAGVDSLPRMVMRVCTGLVSSVAASSDSRAGCPGGVACTHAQHGSSRVPYKSAGACSRTCAFPPSSWLHDCKLAAALERSIKRCRNLSIPPTLCMSIWACSVSLASVP